MNSISAVTQSNLAKYVAPIRTAIEIGGTNDASKSHAAAETAPKAVSSINLKGSVVNKTLQA